MKKTDIKEVWGEFLLDEDEDYTLLEATTVIKKSLLYMKTKGVRITEEMLIFPKIVMQQYCLTDVDKAFYMARFKEEQYNTESCEKLLQVMEAVYRYFDLTREETETFVLCMAEKKMKLSDALKQKFGIDLEEIDEYMQSVLQENLTYCEKKSVQYGKEFLEILGEILKEL